MSNRPTLGTTIRQERHRCGMTLRDVADRVGIDFTYISKIENGHECSVSEATVRRLAEVLGVTGDVDQDAWVFMSGKIPERIRSVMLDYLHPHDAARLFRADGLEAIARDFQALRRVIEVFVPAGVNVQMHPWQREALDDATRTGAMDWLNTHIPEDRP